MKPLCYFLFCVSKLPQSLQGKKFKLCINTGMVASEVKHVPVSLTFLTLAVPEKVVDLYIFKL